MNFPLILLVAVLVSGLVYIFNKIIRMPHWLNEYVGSFFPVLLAVFVLRSFVVEPFRIPSGSMLPTLYIGDFILVNKFSYGIRLPVVNKKVISFDQPKNGDVIVFRYPGDESVNFIKRLIGIPGDKVEYRNKRLTINGVELALKSEGVFNGAIAGEPDLEAQVLSEKLGSVSHKILWDEGGINSVLKFTVPEGKYFVMGDNRDHSNDSRYWGFVEDRHLVGKAFFIWLNFDKGNINWNRVGDIII